MPKARKPAPAMYSQKGSTPTESDQKPSTRTEQKAGAKKTNRDSSGQTRAANQGANTESPEARAKVSDSSAIKKPTSEPIENQNMARAANLTSDRSDSDNAEPDGQLASETTTEAAANPVKEIPLVAFCANGFILANAHRLGEEFKLEVSSFLAECISVTSTTNPVQENALGLRS
jgi:hypothetical protein